jgi:protein SCO1/2
MRGRTKIALILTLFAFGAILGWLLADPDAGLAPRPKGGDFTLTSADGPVALRSFRGKVVLLYFGYTNCPDICPSALSFTAMALERLSPAERERVRAIFVSVDPERDTPEKLKGYAAYFHPNVIGVTGDHRTLAEIAARYGAAYRRSDIGSASGYAVDHTSFTYVIAPDGRLAESLPHGTPPDQVASAVRRWLEG